MYWILDEGQCKYDTSILSNSSLSPVRLGVNFVLPMSQQQEQHEQEQEQPPPKSILNLTLKSKSCYYKKGLKIHKKKMH